MSSSPRRHWFWRVLVICLIGIALLLCTDVYLMMWNRQTAQVGLDASGNRWQVLNGVPLDYSPSLVSNPSSWIPPQSPMVNPMATPLSSPTRNAPLQAQPFVTVPSTSDGFVPFPSASMQNPSSPKMAETSSVRQSDTSIDRSMSVSQMMSVEVRQLLVKLRGLEDQDSEHGKKLKAELRETLEREFNKKHQQHQQAIVDLEDQLDRARQLYTKREANKGQIIDRRTTQLLAQPDDLSWDVADINPRPLVNHAVSNFPQPLPSLPSSPMSTSDSKVWINIPCDGKDAVLVQQFLKKQFADQANIKFEVRDKNVIDVLLDGPAFASGVGSRISAAVEALDPAKFQRQPASNGMFNGRLTSHDNALLGNPTSNSSLSSTDFESNQTPSPALSSSQPQANLQDNNIPPADSNHLSALSPQTTLLLTMISEDQIEIEMTPRRFQLATTTFSIANLKDGLSQIQPGTIVKVVIVTPADTNMDAVSQLMKQVLRIRPESITLKHQSLDAAPLADVSLGKLHTPNTQGSDNQPTLIEESASPMSPSTLDSKLSEPLSQPNDQRSDRQFPAEDGALQKEPMMDGESDANGSPR